MAKRYVAPQNTQALVRGGLTQTQAALYETLVQHGALNARRASFMAGISRTLGYKVLNELESLGLVVKKDEPRSVAVFVPAHPLKLKELAEQRLADAQSSKIALDGALSKLIDDFEHVSGQPKAQVLEGVSGLKELIESQVSHKKPLRTAIIENSPTKLTFSVIFEAL